MGWHFSRYDGPKEWDFVIQHIQIGFFRGSRYTKIRHMDDDNARMPRGKVFDETFQVAPGIYILDFSDWSNDYNLDAAISVDDKPIFSTSSYGIDRHNNRSFNINNWHNSYGADVRQTDDREIAFHLD